MGLATTAPPDGIEERKGASPLNPSQAAERRAKELTVWNQIRRIEEELMEMGTMEHALLQGDSVGVH